MACRSERRSASDSARDSRGAAAIVAHANCCASNKATLTSGGAVAVAEVNSPFFAHLSALPLAARDTLSHCRRFRRNFRTAERQCLFHSERMQLTRMTTAAGDFLSVASSDSRVAGNWGLGSVKRFS